MEGESVCLCVLWGGGGEAKEDESKIALNILIL